MEEAFMRKMKTTHHRIVSDDYLKLINRFPLRRLRSADEHRSAGAIVDQLVAKGDESMTAGEADYLGVLAGLVDDYERVHLQQMIGRAKPVETLKFLMESRDMAPSTLGEVIGSRSAASMILKGQRQMSKSHIRKLAVYFNVSPAVFLD